MAIAGLETKVISLSMEETLYSFLESQADENGETLNDLIQRMLMESMESWYDYCETLRTLSNEEGVRFHVCVSDDV